MNFCLENYLEVYLFMLINFVLKCKLVLLKISVTDLFLDFELLNRLILVKNIPAFQTLLRALKYATSE